MKILIIEAYTDANIGSGALVENTIKLLRQKLQIKDEDLTLMAHYPSVFEKQYKVKSIPDFFEYPYGRSRLFQAFWLVKTIIWMLKSWLFPKSSLKTNKWKEFNNADLVVSIGAERINDKYIKNEFFSLFTYAMVKRMGKKMILFPSTYGPFLYKFTKKITAKIFKNIDLIYCRDQKSYDTVLSFKGINRKHLINTYDVAIFQDWDKNYKNKFFSDNRKIVGISILKWIYVANKYETEYSNYEAYVSEMVKLSDYIIRTYDVNILFLPTNYPMNGCYADDVIVGKEIILKSSNKERMNIVEYLPSPYEFKSILSSCEANITTRMHACILSTSAYIPTMSINYLFKLKEYMELVGLGDFTIDIEDFNTRDSIEIFNRLWENRVKINTNLKTDIETMKKSLYTDIVNIKNISE